MTPFAQIFGYSLAALGVISAFWFLKKHQYRLAAFVVSGAFIIFGSIQLFSRGLSGIQNLTVYLGYSLVTFGVCFTFWLLKKKKYRIAAFVISGAFIVFGAIQLFSNGLLVTQNLTIEQFLCWGFGLALFTLSVYFAHKNSLSYAFAVLVMSAFAIFCGLSGVQAFLKTHLLWQITTSLKNYGEKLDSFQTTVLDMRKGLTEQQAILASNQIALALLVTNVENDFSRREHEITTNQTAFQKLVYRQGNELAVIEARIQDAESNVLSQQSDITKQFLKLSLIHSNLDLVQVDILSQERQLTNVESLVNALYSNTEDELIETSDTNNLIVLKQSGRQIVFMKLKHVPIPNSIQGIVSMHGEQMPISPKMGQSKNIVISVFSREADLNGHFALRYIKSPESTDIVKNMVLVNSNTIAYDGLSIQYRD